MIARTIAAIPESVPIVVVGPTPPTARLIQVTEESPRGAGPLAAIAAGLRSLGGQPDSGRLVGVLAADMPWSVPVLHSLLTRLQDSPQVDAVVPLDDQPQPLCAAYRAPSLRKAISALEPVENRAARLILEHLRVMRCPVPTSDLVDVDTQEDLLAARGRAAAEGTDMDEWVAAVAKTLGIDVAVDLDLILDVARDTAHGVKRPAAPVTTFLLGAAVARGADPTQAAAAISELAASWGEIAY